MSSPCACWVAPVSLHDGHCCFSAYDPASNTVTCGHDNAGMELFEANRAVGVVVTSTEPTAEVVHDCPREGESVTTLCCGRNPFEPPRTDRMTLQADLVTCGVAPDVG